MLMNISEEKLVRPVRNNIAYYLYRKVTNLETEKAKKRCFLRESLKTVLKKILEKNKLFFCFEG